jgi:Uma2 family endonuclease
MLENGDHLDQRTFHDLYEQMPEDTRAELIGGVVYMASPLQIDHGVYDTEVITWLNRYKRATPGTMCFNNATVILGEESEPQPDAALIILPEHGGQARITRKRYLAGAPELIAETANSSAAIDLHAKKDDYEKAGVREYLVVVVGEQRVVWFTRRQRRFHELKPDREGIHRSAVFPGLWLDAAGLFELDSARVEAVLLQGLAAGEHQAFVKKLQAARR